NQLAASESRPTAARAGAPRLLLHVRVAVVGRRRERLLDRPGADPAEQVVVEAGLVVRAARTGAAERLLRDDGAGRLVVDVEVAGRLSESVLRFADRRAVV